MRIMCINGSVTRGSMRQLILATVVWLIGGISGVAMADSAVSSLVYVGYQTTPANTVELQLNFQGEIPTPSYFTSESPARITFDFAGVKNDLPWTLPMKIKGGGNAQSVTAVEAGGRTRVVINLAELVGYETRVDGNSLFVSLGQGASRASSIEQDEQIVQDVDELVSAAAETGMELKAIDYEMLAGNKLLVRLNFNGKAPQPNGFVIDNPSRLVFDLANVNSGLDRSNIDIGVGAAKSVTAVAVGDRTRIVVNLVSAVDYQAVSEGDELRILLENPYANRGDSIASSNKIESIDFRRAEEGQGRIVVNLTSPDVVTDTRIMGSSVIVEFFGTKLPVDLAQRYDVVDFATPVQYIDAKMEGGNSRLVISMGEDFEHLAFQADKLFTLDVKKPVTGGMSQLGDDEYIGDKLSLSFQDIEVRAVLELIADFTGLNMVVSDTVTGNLTLRLKNVPWDQALDIILRTKGLAMRQEANVILVAPSEEIAAREKMELESQKQLSELEPVRTELIQVNYANAGEMAALLSGGAGLLSSRGKVSIDERTNTLIISDIAEHREDVRRLLTKLDIPIRQVMVDSRIVIASSDFSRDLGARFGVTNVSDQGSNLLMTSGTVRATDTMTESAVDPTNTTGTVDIPAGLEDRLNVNMPVQIANAGRYALSILNGGTLLDLELSALQAEGRGEVVSNPRVVTSNGKEALIEQGTDIPYQEASSSGATSVSFKKAVLSLKVKPQITPDDRILMDLEVNKDSVGQVVGNVPSIDTKSVTTQVLVENGETVVLGGVYEQMTRDQVEKVPLLGDIPLLGALFRTTHKEDDKIELLIFVTPKILKEGGRLQ